MNQSCPINRNTVRNGIVKKAEELIGEGVSIQEINSRFGEDFVKSNETKDVKQGELDAIQAFKDLDFSGGVKNWTDIIQSETAPIEDKVGALRELKQQIADKRSEDTVGLALGVHADIVYKLLDESKKAGYSIEPSADLVDRYLVKSIIENAKVTVIPNTSFEDTILRAAESGIANQPFVYKDHIYLRVGDVYVIFNKDGENRRWITASEYNYAAENASKESTVPLNQVSIFTSQPGPTQVTEAGTLTKNKIITFLKKIGFSNIQKVNELVHNGAPIQGDAYIDFLNKTMQIVDGKEDVSLPEEAMHILVELIENSDKNLFRKLEKEIVDYKLYYDVLRDQNYVTNKLYQNEDGSINYTKIKKEAMAKLLAEFLVGDTENLDNQDKVQKIRSWWVAIKDWIRSKFGKFKNPFKEALARLEKDNTAFGEYDDIYSDQVFLAAGKISQRSVSERDEAYNDTKAMFQNIKGSSSRLGFTKIDDQYYQNGKKWEGGRVSDLVDAYYKQLFRNKPLDPSKVDYYEKQAKTGTWLHSLFEDAMNVLVDGETGLLRDNVGIRNAALATTKTEQDISNKVFHYMQAFLKSFPEGTRFLSETIVFDSETQRLGTIDFLAIEPSTDFKEGVVSIYDWKTMRSAQEAADYKKRGIEIQLSEYKDMLKNSYDVVKFDKIRAIPVSRVQKDDEKGGFDLVDIELGSLKLDTISEKYLRPIISERESTGNEYKDELITALSGVYDKFVNLLRADNLPNRQVLTEIADTIYELRVTNSVKNLTIYLQDLQGNMDDLIKLAESEKNFDIDIMTEYLSKISLYETIFDALESAKLLIDDTNVPDKERLALSNVLSRLDRRMFKIRGKDGIREKFLETLAEKEGVYNLLKPEMVIGGMAKLFRTLGNQDFATGRLMYELTNRAYNKLEIETENELKQLADLRHIFNEYAKANGLSVSDTVGKLVNYAKGTLHSKIDAKFFEERAKTFDSKDAKTIVKFVKENYDVEAYNAWYKQELAQQEAFWKEQIYSPDAQENVRIKKAKKRTFAENYDVMKHPLTAFGRHNPQVWGKNIKEDLWLSDAYKELQKPENAPLMKVYEYFLAKNRELFEVGAIKEWQQYTFLPNVRKGFADIMSFDDSNWLSKIKDVGFNSYRNWLKSLSVGDYELNFQGRKDEITGEKLGQRYISYVNPLSAEDKSYDVFSIYGLMIKQIQKEKQLSDNDEILKGLLAVESNKQTFESNKFGVIAKRGEKLQLSKEKGKNAELLKKYYKAIVEGELLQIDSDHVVSFRMREKWNNSVMGKIWKFDIDPETYNPTKISPMKTLMWMNNLNQKRILGLNFASGISNFFGSSFAASKLYKKYFSEADLRMAHTRMISGAFYATEDMKKRAALVDYFLPLLDNRAHFKSTQLSVNQASRILSQEWLMSPQRKTDEIVQLNIFLAYLENTGLIDGKLVNLREMAANETGYKGRFADGENIRTVKEQKEIAQKFEERLSKLKEQYKLMDKVVFKEVERNGKKETIVEIPGVDRMGKDVETLRSILHTISKDATGNMDDFDMAPYRYNIYWRLFMTFKNWIPRQVDVRFGEFHKSQSHNAYEYGRFRMFYRAVSTNWLKSAAKLVPLPYITGAITKNVGREDYIKKAIEVYKDKKKQFQDLGLYDKRDFITQDEFIDMYMQGINNSFIEFRTMAFMLLLLTFGLMKPDDDDDNEEKSMKKLVRRQIDRMSNEISFFYSPASLYNVAAQGPPILGLFHDMYNVVTNVSQQWFGATLEGLGFDELGEKMQKGAHPLKYTFKVLPVLKEVLTYIPTFDNELAKDWDITISNK